MTTHTHAEQPRRFGFWRWVWLALMILGGWLAFGLGGIWKPVPPAVVLPAEPAWPGLYIAPGIPFTNTMLSAFVAGLLIFGFIILTIQGHVRSGNQAPTGFWYNAIEALIEFFWNATQSAAGKWARRIFPFSMTIFLMVLSVNVFKLLPIHETIGYTKVAHGNIQGYATVPVLGGAVHLLDGSHPHEAEAAATGEAEAGHGEEASEYWNSAEPCESCEIVPTFRGAATDLNFTAALALITMVMVQVFGVWALGPDTSPSSSISRPSSTSLSSD
ncbi:MAG: F0F1 ATP synthase subunit A [Anaerolineales bacterium]